MIDGAADEQAVCELRHLNGGQRSEMSFITDSATVSEKPSKRMVNVERREEVCYLEVFGGGVNEIDAGVVAGDVKLAGRVGGEAPGKRRKEGESVREGQFEKRKERVEGKRRGSQQNALLNVMTR